MLMVTWPEQRISRREVSTWGFTPVYGTNWGIEVFFKRYFGNFSFHVRYCGII